MAKAVAVGPDQRALAALTVDCIRVRRSSRDLEAYGAMVALFDQAIVLYERLVNDEGRRELNHDLREACALREMLIKLLDNSAAAGDEPHQALLRKNQPAYLELLAKKCSELWRYVKGS
jgi:hypothetical protein